MIHDYLLYLPTRVFFGPSKKMAFFRWLKQQNRHWLIVTGGSSVNRNGTFAAVSDDCEQAGITWTHFAGIEPNPDISTVSKAIEAGRRQGCTGVIALGGGSVMDASKAISIGLALGETDLWPYVSGSRKLAEGSPAFPLACIPTTAGTAAEVTPYAVLSNRLQQEKNTWSHELLYPDAAWLNPVFTLSVPQSTTAENAADILSHVFENYILGGSYSPLADAHSEAIIKQVMVDLPVLWDNPGDLEARTSMMMCANWALNGFQDAGRKPAPYILHGIEHVMSAWKPDLAHGMGLSTLFPAYFHWLLQHHRAEARLSRLSAVIFGHQGGSYDGKQLVIELHQWLQKFGLGKSMADLGFTPDTYAPMAARVMSRFRHAEADVEGNFTAANIVEIFDLTRFQQAKSET